MTVTISRLYDSYDEASRAVRDLEAAGLSHSNISLVSSNADNWYSGDSKTVKGKKVDRDADGVDDRLHLMRRGLDVELGARHARAIVDGRPVGVPQVDAADEGHAPESRFPGGSDRSRGCRVDTPG